MTNQPDNVDLTGFSLSLSRFTRTSSISLGFAIASGDGDAQVVAGSTQKQVLEHSIETLYLSTSYHL